MLEINPYVQTPAIRIVQPLGAFYVTRIEAGALLEIAFSDPLRTTTSVGDETPYSLQGSQRQERDVRWRDIGKYINTVEAAFPNSIILGANYDEDGHLLDAEDARRWRIESDGGPCVNLIIPTATKLATIIDGQHRLHGFRFADPERLSMQLLCAVYLDLPNPYQAYLFATINFNQKKVDKSLAYELFGFDIENEPPTSWSPEKTAVFFSRKLNTDDESPLRNHITVAPLYDELSFPANGDGEWRVSTATVVDGALKLFSANPKRDRDRMHVLSIESGRSRSMLADDGTPLRGLYLETNDKAIYTALKNFFTAVQQSLWLNENPRTYLKKTVGIQALFDILRVVLRDFEEQKNISVPFFIGHLERANYIDFSDEFFQASGKGRTRIRNALELAIGLKDEQMIPQADLAEYRRVTARP